MTEMETGELPVTNPGDGPILQYRRGQASGVDLTYGPDTVGEELVQHTHRKTSVVLSSKGAALRHHRPQPADEPSRWAC
jgi:hypothetical protein